MFDDPVSPEPTHKQIGPIMDKKTWYAARDACAARMICEGDGFADLIRATAEARKKAKVVK